MTVFGDTYSGVYDDIYREKDYQSECAMIARIFKTYGKGPVKTVLDLGCGTGNHDLILAEKGFAVDGADLSKEMLDIAKNKAKARGLPINYHLSDIRDLDLGKRFDAAVMMFAVLGYQLENEDVIRALKATRKHLGEGGLLIMDLWYGPAVLRQRPSDKVKIIKAPGSTIIRTSSGELDTYRQICTVSFDLWKLQGDKLISETQEKHAMRFFFARELEALLDAAGFGLVKIGAFPDYDLEPTEETWNIVVIARAREH
jgi:SAM-dependent methyltransferase